MKAFYDAMVAIGENDKVTLFTVSDFSLTFKLGTAVDQYAATLAT